MKTEIIRRAVFFVKEYYSNHKQVLRVIFAILIGIYFVLYQLFLKAPADFPINKMVHIDKGLGLKEISKKLEENQVIKSPLSFELFVVFLGRDRKVMAGDYLFSETIWLPKVALRMVLG